MLDQKIFQFSFGDGYAGSAKVALLSSLLLSERGHKVTLFVTEGSLTGKRAGELGINYVPIRITDHKKIWFKKIIEVFEEERPQFAIAHHSLDRKIGLKLKRKYKSFINIAYRHNITKSAPIIGSFLYNTYFDYLIAVSGGVADSLISSGIRKKKVKIIYNGISVPDNLDRISGDRIKEKFIPEGKTVLGLSTWFHKERKGFDILFNAFSKLNDSFVLFLVGVTPESKLDVIDYAKEFGIDESKIIMPGYVENIWEYYKAMDIFLLPSRSEGFSLALLEAAAAGLPVIASDIPGNNEFIKDGVNGLLFDVKVPMQLKNKIENLSGDIEQRSYLSQNASGDIYNNFLISHYTDRLENFLNEIISLKGDKS